jgi:hypothetical protein
MESDQPNRDIGDFKPKKVPASEVYRFLYTYFIHLDRLLWSRIQAIVAIEVATLAGATAARHEGEAILGMFVLAAGTLLVLLIYGLILRDREIRDSYFAHLDSVNQPLKIRFTCEPEFRCRKGSTILRVIVWGLIFGNVGLAVYYGWRPWHMIEPPQKIAAIVHPRV